jgi:hypothetical protein
MIPQNHPLDSLKTLYWLTAFTIFCYDSMVGPLMGLPPLAPASYSAGAFFVWAASACAETVPLQELATATETESTLSCNSAGE